MARRPSLKTGSTPETHGAAVWIRALLILLAGVLAYGGSFSHPFIFDDVVGITDNPALQEPTRLAGILQPEHELPTAGRPLPSLTFALNHAVGGLDVRGYHLVNLAVHLVCALLVFALAWRTFEWAGFPATLTGSALDLAFATALVWVVHPLNSEAVDYVTQRTESMMAACLLLTLYASIRAANQPAAARWFALAWVACACGMLCKESMVTAPILVVLYDRVFLFGSWRSAARARWRLYGALASTWIVLGAILSTGPRSHSTGFSTGVGVWTYLLNQAAVIVHYLRLAVWPRGLVLMYGPPETLTLAAVLLQAIAIVALLVATGWALRRRPAFGFVGAWIFLTLAPTSSFVPIATEVGAERRMYLPLVALIALLVAVAGALSRVATPAGRRRFAVAMTLAVALLTIGTIVRTQEYASAVAMANTVVERRPNGFAHWMLGTDLARAGRSEEGLRELHEATRLGESRASYDIGVVRFKSERFEEAIGALDAFVDANPSHAQALSARVMLAQADARLTRWGDAIDQSAIALTMDPNNLEAIGVLGAAAVHLGRYDEAIARCRQYLARRPDDVTALTSLGVALAATDRAAEARAVFERAATLAPTSAMAQLGLAVTLLEQHDADGASGHAQRAISLDPGNPATHDTLGRVLAVQGQFDAAAAQFEEALRLDPGYADAREHLKRLAQVREIGRVRK